MAVTIDCGILHIGAYIAINITDRMNKDVLDILRTESAASTYSTLHGIELRTLHQLCAP